MVQVEYRVDATRADVFRMIMPRWAGIVAATARTVVALPGHGGLVALRRDLDRDDVGRSTCATTTEFRSRIGNSRRGCAS